MTAEARRLPKYKKPPVVEVAIGVRFKPLPRFTSAYFGKFWALNPEYVDAQDFPPLIESVTAELLQLPPLRRVFLTTADNNFLIQLQSDFFGHNWRKGKPTDEYPSFEQAKARFINKWANFQKFVGDHKLGDLQLARYEVTYVNHFVDQPGAFPLAIDKYSPVLKLRSPSPEYFLPLAKSLLAQIDFEIPDNRGTLLVSFKQGVRQPDGAEVMQVDLTARTGAKPDGSDLLDWLEIAHEWIVRGFTDLTSEEAHKLWERVI